jgi:hypothetical protein
LAVFFVFFWEGCAWLSQLSRRTIQTTDSIQCLQASNLLPVGPPVSLPCMLWCMCYICHLLLSLLLLLLPDCVPVWRAARGGGHCRVWHGRG